MAAREPAPAQRTSKLHLASAVRNTRKLQQIKIIHLLKQPLPNKIPESAKNKRESNDLIDNNFRSFETTLVKVKTDKVFKAKCIVKVVSTATLVFFFKFISNSDRQV